MLTPLFLAFCGGFMCSQVILLYFIGQTLNVALTFGAAWFAFDVLYNAPAE